MNEKIRNFLHTAWHEPRQFFLWMILLSICGFAIAALSANLIGPIVLVGGLALVSFLCFIGSLLAFILSWIPPIRTLLSWLLRWRFLALCCAITLIALFYAVEDWRGRRAWQNFKREREAKGEKFELANFVPPSVPNNENFFESPLWNDLHFTETNRPIAWNDQKWEQHVIFSRLPPKCNDVPGDGNWAKSQHMDLAAWQDLYRGSNNLSAEHLPAADRFPVAKEPQSPAADVLLALSRYQTNRQTLLATSARPHARFWMNYPAGIVMGTGLQHLARIKTCSSYLSLHATAALKANDSGTALDDTKMQFRLIDSLHEEPILISHLVRAALLQIALQPVWEGLADHRWADADLNTIESELGKFDFLADYVLAMRSERACNLWFIDFIHTAGLSQYMDLFPSEKKEEGSQTASRLVEAITRVIPAGRDDQNKLSICRGYEAYVLPAVDRERRLAFPDVPEKSQAAVKKMPMRPFDIWSPLMLPALFGSSAKFARAQSSADLARVACALERYRLANGQLPETLDALAPKFIDAVPHDIITGQPLKYRRTPDGQFVLYSVGWNQADDGGKVELTKQGGLDVKHGDWVWRY